MSLDPWAASITNLLQQVNEMLGVVIDDAESLAQTRKCLAITCQGPNGT